MSLVNRHQRIESTKVLYPSSTYSYFNLKDKWKIQRKSNAGRVAFKQAINEVTSNNQIIVKIRLFVNHYIILIQ